MKILLFCVFALFFSARGICAEEEGKSLTVLAQEITQLKNSDEIHAGFEKIKDAYFKEHKYNEFMEFLVSLEAKDGMVSSFVNYYRGLCRFNQLRYLEESQVWEEYFSKGSVYEDELVTYLKKAVLKASSGDLSGVYSRLILWQFYKDKQNDLAGQALSDLVNSVFSYAKLSDNASPIKDIASELLSYGEKVLSHRLYKLYVDKVIVVSADHENLKSVAVDCYKQGELELSEAFYDAYIEKASKKINQKEMCTYLLSIAREFVYQDKALNDPAYAEKLFSKADELSSRESLEPELVILRAFNLERLRDFAKAKICYQDIFNRGEGLQYFDEAAYKLGFINVYILNNLKEGKNYFLKISDRKENINFWVIESLYQLGLFSQWEKDLAAAQEYYNKLQTLSAGNYKETESAALARIKEITEERPMEYNLKLFLDTCLSGNVSKLNLKGYPYQAAKTESVKIAMVPYAAESGCMPVKLEYLWSGDLDGVSPGVDKSSFELNYSQTGLKQINLVVVSSSGVMGYACDLINVEEKT